MSGLSTDRRRPLSAVVAGSVALALGLASMASTVSAAGATAPCVRRSAWRRRPLLPDLRQRWLRRPPLRPRRRLRPGDGRARRRGVDIQRDGHPDPVQLQSRPRRARRYAGRGRRQAGSLEPRTARSSPSRPSTPLKTRPRFEVERRYDGVPVEFVIPGFGSARSGPASWPRPTAPRSPASPRSRRGWFPVNDHPLRQGLVLVRRHGARTATRWSPTGSCETR